MALPEQITNAYKTILREELLVAMGCTEPISIAYAAAIVRRALGKIPERMMVELSGNIIKNVKSVIVPATGGLHGIEAAVAAGVVAGAPEKKLEVLSVLQEHDRNSIVKFMDQCAYAVTEMNSIHPFDMRLTGYAGTDFVSVRIQKNHTNVTRVEHNGKDITTQYLMEQEKEEDIRTDRSILNVQDIVTFAQEADLEDIKPLLLRQIEMNMSIAMEGIESEWGASIGKVLYQGGKASVRDRARALAAAGSDARMSGCEMPVAIISGSGNQGMTASIPVVVYARDMGASEELMLRALVISDLVTIHQKTGIGTLSAYCGAISAGCGAGCGIAFLNGGGFYEIAHTLVNAVAILSGTICDGAKPSCAAKIAMAVEAGIMGYEMMRSGHQFLAGDGIITKGVENTIYNVGRLARDGMTATDKEIIRIMLS